MQTSNCYADRGSRRSFPKRHSLLASVGIAALVLFSTSFVVAANEKVGADVYAALQEAAATRVMVVFSADGAARDAARNVAGRLALNNATDALLKRMQGSGFTLKRRFETVAAFAAMVDAPTLAKLAADPEVLRIDLDAGGYGHMNQAAPLSNVDEVRAVYNGSGMTVAIVDSGIRANHGDLSSSLVAEQCFCSGVAGSVGCCPNGLDTQSGSGAANDDNGHGTNVTGIVSGNGTIAPQGGAPAADIVSVKVLDANNSFCCSSDVVAAMDWIAVNRPEVDVVNLSLGTGALFPGACDSATSFTIALTAAVDNLVAQGRMVFASSGNQASSTSMSAPACSERAVAVAAVWDSNVGSVTILGCTDSTTAADKVTCFSNTNTSTDLLAPGAPITSTGNGGGSSTYYGTSQASPLTAACAADLRQAHPTRTPYAVEAALQASTTRVTDISNAVVMPRLDCAQSLAFLTDSIFLDGFGKSP